MVLTKGSIIPIRTPMPIYEYKCEACEELTELLQKMSDPPPETCEKCGQGPMVKQLSQTSFVLKGGGWYNDAYSSKKPESKSESKESTNDKKDSSDTTSKSEPSSSPKSSTKKESSSSD